MEGVVGVLQPHKEYNVIGVASNGTKIDTGTDITKIIIRSGNNEIIQEGGEWVLDVDYLVEMLYKLAKGE